MLTRTKRRVIFYLLILAFLIGGTGVVFYAQGYRLDAQSLAIRKIGAIYIHTSPADAEIFLDNAPVRRPFSIFGSGVLISDLFPKTYTLKAQKEGFKPWKVEVGVQPAIVTEFKRAVLVPSIPELMSVTSTSLTNVQLVGSDLLMQNTDGNLLLHNLSVSGNEIVGASDDGLLLVTRDTKTNTFFRVDAQTASSTSLAPLLRALGLQSGTVIVDPRSSSNIIVKTNRTLALVSLGSRTQTIIETLQAGEAFSDVIATSPSRIAWTVIRPKATTSRLVLWNKNSRRIESSTTEIQGKTVELAWSENNLLGILQNDGDLYLYDPASEALKSQANDVKMFAFSNDGSMLGTIEHRSVEVFSLRNDDYSRLNIPNIDEAQGITWYIDRSHIMLHFKNTISFVSLEDRSLENIQEIAASSKGVYDPRENRFYFLQNQSLYRLTFPQ